MKMNSTDTVSQNSDMVQDAERQKSANLSLYADPDWYWEQAKRMAHTASDPRYDLWLRVKCLKAAIAYVDLAMDAGKVVVR